MTFAEAVTGARSVFRNSVAHPDRVHLLLADQPTVGEMDDILNSVVKDAIKNVFPADYDPPMTLAAARHKRGVAGYIGIDAGEFRPAFAGAFAQIMHGTVRITTPDGLDFRLSFVFGPRGGRRRVSDREVCDAVHALAGGDAVMLQQEAAK